MEGKRFKIQMYLKNSSESAPVKYIYDIFLTGFTFRTWNITSHLEFLRKN
jgi:hypothetical protein